MKRETIVVIGALLLAVSVCGMAYACRVALAQADYCRAKYGTARDLDAQLALYESALRLYRYNYYFSILAAEHAYDASITPGAVDATGLLLRARRACDEGLALNPYRVQLRRLKTCLMAMTSASDAARYWESYVDWQYWEPANHALLVELYALTGDFDKAVDSLALIQGTSYHDAARKKLADAWAKEQKR